MGTEAPSSRAINVNVTIPSEYGTLLTPTGEWEDNAFQDVAIVSALNSETIQQPLRILSGAESYQHVQLIVDLYLASPGPQKLQDENELEEVVLVQRMEVRIQISNHYVYNPLSSFLLVTNSETTRHRSQEIQTFISESLDMEFDT
jgi:hypothetical protein